MNKDFKNRIIKAINKGINEALDLTLDDSDIEDNDIIKVDKNFDSIKDAYQIEAQIKIDRAVQNKDWKTVKELYETNNIQYTVKDEKELQQIIKDYIEFDGNECDLNWIDTSNITDMSSLFIKTFFNGDISKWNTSNVKYMDYMFYNAINFNQPIGNWDVSNVEDMNRMFYGAISFNQPIGDWDVSNVEDMNRLFCGAISFNQPIGNWDVSKVEKMSSMFEGADSFNQPIGDWNTSNVRSMGHMFANTSKFNQPIGNWNTSNVKNMTGMFYCASSFNQPIGKWDVSNVNNYSNIFYYAKSFNQDISKWNINLINEEHIFLHCPIKNVYKPKIKKRD